jgi:hypothetical protein
MTKTIPVLSTLVVTTMCAPAFADYDGLTIEMHTSVDVNGSMYDVWRLYANFTNPGDRLVTGFGSPTLGAITLQTRNSNDTDFGNPFLRVGGLVTAPSQDQIDNNPAAQWSTFVTLGVSIRDQAPLLFGDMTMLTPGFVPIEGVNWSQSNQAWFTFPTFDHDSNPNTPHEPPVQTVAGWQGDGDALNRVLMAQLTVQSGENVRGTINLAWFHAIGGGGQFELQESVQTFNSFIVPGPSVLAALGMMTLMARGRRRK